MISFLITSLVFITASSQVIARPPQNRVTDNSDAALRAAIAKGGTVTFSFSGTIALTNVITVSQSVTVDAETNKITIDGSNTNQLFHVAPGATLTFLNSTLINGSIKGGDGFPGQGGAVLNEGTFAATQCIFSNNFALGGQTNSADGITGVSALGGAVYSTGSLYLTNSMFFGNEAQGGSSLSLTHNGHGYGGALYIQSGIAYLSNCALMMNSATGGVGTHGLGGAIFNAGELAAKQCVLSNNSASGGPGAQGISVSPGSGGGGAVFSSGNLLLTNLIFSGNQSRGGTLGFSWAAPAFGGALYIASGNAFITNSLFDANRAVTPGADSTYHAFGGAGYFATGKLAFAHCQFTGNVATTGSGSRGFNGLGGALYLASGDVEISASQFRTNSSIGGDGGTMRDPNGGGAGRGGAIYIDAAHTQIHETSLIDNLAQAGQSGGFHPAIASGSGGGIFINNGDLTLLNSTIVSNRATSGYFDQIPASVSGDAHGAGIYNAAGQLHISFSTIAGNQDQYWAPAQTSGNLDGDGIYNSGTVILDNSILAEHAHGNVVGPITDSGHNISSDSSTHFSTSLENTDPKLGPLADNGGPTLTMALLDGSPAIDTAATNGPSIDQREQSRPYGAGFDIGAVELSPLRQPIILQSEFIGGKLQITFTARQSKPYDLISTTDFQTWTKASTQTTDEAGVGSFLIDLSGSYQFFIVAESTLID